MPDEPIRVLFICLGNICRSPLAEAIFRHEVETRGLADRFRIDSAGTSNYHVGSPPDERSAEVARARGIRMGGTSRPVVAADLREFNYLIAMDAANLRELRRLQAETGGDARIHRLREWDPQGGDHDVPDPYFGGPKGFENVHDVIARSCAALADHIVADHELA